MEFLIIIQDLLHEDDAMDDEGFEIATGRKRRRINSCSTEKIYRKFFLKTDTGTLNAVCAQKEVSSLLCRNNVDSSCQG